MPSTTCIRNAACIVAWDAANRRHAYLMGGDVAFAVDTLTYVGKRYDGTAEETIDGTDLMVMPGLIDLHAHPSTEPFFRGVREEHGVPAMYMSGLYERSVALQPDADARKAGKQVAFCEMLLSGITSVADLSGIDEGWIDLAAQSGLRVFLAPSYASARWHLENGWALQYRWDETAGRRGLDAALALIEQAAAHPSGRLSGIVSPAQIDTCTTDLLRDSFAAAEARDVPLTVHCAQSVNEFLVMVDRHGKSPVQFARDLGILSPRTCWGTRCSSTSIHGCAGIPTAISEFWSIPAPASRIARRRSPATATRWRISAAIIAPASISASARTWPHTTSSRRCGWARSWRVWRRATSPRPAWPRCSMPRRWAALPR